MSLKKNSIISHNLDDEKANITISEDEDSSDEYK